MGRTVRRSCRGEGHVPLPSSTVTDPGTGILPLPGSWWRSLYRISAPARNSNSGTSETTVLSRPAGLSGVSVPSESEMAKYYQLQQVPRDADAGAVAVITAWWTKQRRTSGDLKDLDNLDNNLETSIDAIALAPLPVDLVVTVLQTPIETLNFASKAGSRSPPPPLSPLLVQLHTVSKMTA